MGSPREWYIDVFFWRVVYRHVLLESGISWVLLESGISWVLLESGISTCSPREWYIVGSSREWYIGVFFSRVVYRGFEPRSVKQKTIQLVFVASPFSVQY